MGFFDRFRKNSRDPNLQYADGDGKIRDIELPPRDEDGRFISRKEYERRQAIVNRPRDDKGRYISEDEYRKQSKKKRK